MTWVIIAVFVVAVVLSDRRKPRIEKIKGRGPMWTSAKAAEKSGLDHFTPKKKGAKES